MLLPVSGGERVSYVAARFLLCRAPKRELPLPPLHAFFSKKLRIAENRSTVKSQVPAATALQSTSGA